MSIQTSDSDLKAAQNPPTVVSGANLNGVPDAVADACIFNNCNFSDGLFGSPSHRCRFTGTATFNSDLFALGFSGVNPLESTFYLSGSANTLSMGYGDSSSVLYQCGVDLSGSVETVNISVGDTIDAGNSWTLAIDQTSPLTVNTEFVGPYAGIAIVASNASHFTLGGSSLFANGGNLNISANAATYVDMSYYTGAVAIYSTGVPFVPGFSFNSCNAPLIGSSISLGGTGGDDFGEQWSGPFTSAFVDALIIAWNNGGTSNTSLVIGGSSASPTSASAAALANLIANGCTVTTN